MPANPTPDFKMLPGIRDIFPEHFSPRRPQHPTEPRRAPLGPAPAENYFFGVLKHNPRSASLDDHKHNHPMPDPKRWYSQPVHAEDAEDTADGVSAKQGRGEEMDDRQSQAGSPYPSHCCTLHGAGPDFPESAQFPLPPFPVASSPPMGWCHRCRVWQELYPPPPPRHMLSPAPTRRSNSSQMRPIREDFLRAGGKLKMR